MVADQDQYLRVCYRDGRKEHIRGPCFKFHDPIEHNSITTLDAICLDAFEAVVVYRETCRSPDGATITPVEPILELSDLSNTKLNKEAAPELCVHDAVEKRVVRGPTLFIPAANEWLHEFSWHGSDPEDKGRLIKGSKQFTQLRTVPAQLYYNVSDVRTQDDAMLVVKLMVFYHINSIEEMLDATSDPIGDFSNAVCADVIRFASAYTFEDFLQQTNSLNDLATFPVLVQRAEAVGFSIDKVVFRGYKASEHLQKVYDDAIQTRAHMRLKNEEAEQLEAAEDLKLVKRLERSQRERQLQLEEKNHQLSLAQIAHAHEMKVQQEVASLRVESQRCQMAGQLEHVKRLAELDSAVDLTKVIVSLNQVDSQVIRVEGPTDTQVHVGTK